MKMVREVLAVLIGATASSGCVREAAPTVEYFRAHSEERSKQLARCANDPGSLKESPWCINAQQADELERHDLLRNLPAMGLQEETPPMSDKEPAAQKPQ